MAGSYASCAEERGILGTSILETIHLEISVLEAEQRNVGKCSKNHSEDWLAIY